MDSKKLQVLIKAVEEGSFTKATESVGYTQSGLTNLMNTLEKEIGFPLLHRSHSGITWSPEGQKLLPFIQQFVQAGARLENAAAGILQNKQETIRVAAYSSIALHWMPEILYRFRRICPNIAVELRMVDHALEPFELLESGQSDVIFASRQQYDSCDWTPLYSEKLYAILPLDYPLRGRSRFPLQEFQGQEFLMPYGRFDLEVNAAMKKTGLHLNARESRVDDETVIRMIGQGLGVSIMSELMIRGRTQGIQAIPIEPMTLRELGMGTLHGGTLTPGILKLKECVINFLRSFKALA